jgi:hypothetical protein
LFVFSGVLYKTLKTKEGATQITLKTNNDLQNTTQKTRDGATQITLKTNNVVCLAPSLVVSIL